MVFDPKFNQALPTEQAVVRAVPQATQAPTSGLENALGAVNSLAGFFGGEYAKSVLAKGKTTGGPKAGEIEDAQVAGFVNEYGDLLTAQAKTGRGQRLKKEALREAYLAHVQANPQSATKIKNVIQSSTGLDLNSEADNMEAQQYEGLIKYGTENPSKAAIAQARATSDDGNFDETKYVNVLNSLMVQDDARKQELAVSNDELQLTQNDEERRKLGAANMTSKMTNFWSAEVSDTLSASAQILSKNGADAVDVQTVLGGLRQSKMQLMQKFRTEGAQFDGLRASEVDAAAAQAVKGIDDMIAMIEANLNDPTAIRNSMNAMAQIDMARILQPEYGSIAQTTPFLNLVGETYGTQIATSAATAIAEQAGSSSSAMRFSFDAVGAGVSATDIVNSTDAAAQFNKLPDVQKRTKEAIEAFEPLVKAGGAKGDTLKGIIGSVGVALNGKRADLPAIQKIFTPAVMEKMGVISNNPTAADRDALDGFIQLGRSQVDIQLSHARELLGDNGTIVLNTQGNWELSINYEKLRQNVQSGQFAAIGAGGAVGGADLSDEQLNRMMDAGIRNQVAPYLKRMNFIERQFNNTMKDQWRPVTKKTKDWGSPNAIGDALQIDFANYEDQYKLPAGFLERTAFLESSGNPNAKNPYSSAGGLFQFVDGTAKQYGLTDKMNAQESTRAASELARDNIATFKRIVGREPSAAELYLAHQQGAVGAGMLINNRNRPAIDVLTGIYGNAEKARAALLNNAGTMDMTAGEFASKWINKFNGLKGTSANINSDVVPSSYSNYREEVARGAELMGQTLAAEAANMSGINDQLAGFSEMGAQMAEEVTGGATTQAPVTPTQEAAQAASEAQQGDTAAQAVEAQTAQEQKQQTKLALGESQRKAAIAQLSKRELGSLSRRGLNPENIPVFESVVDALEAVANGEIEKGSIYITVDGDIKRAE